MAKALYTLVLVFFLVGSAVAAPVVTPGPPLESPLRTVDPGSIRVDMLGDGESVDVQLSVSFHPFCVAPIDIVVSARGDGGAFTDLTGALTNFCGGDTSVFDIRLTGDGTARIFEIEVAVVGSASTLASVPVELYGSTAPQITLGPPVTDGFLTVDPGSVRVDSLGAGQVVGLALSLTVHPFCIRPIDIIVTAAGDGGAFTDLTGELTNGCGGDVSEFNITLTGDGTARSFDISFIDTESGQPLKTIPVALFPGPAPDVSLGDAVTDGFKTIDPGSIRVEMLGTGNFVDLPIAITVHPFCIVPIDIGVAATGDGGTFVDQTGGLTNSCGGDTSVFNIRLLGDGMLHGYQIDFIDLNSLSTLGSIPVEIYPGFSDTDRDGRTDLIDNCTLVSNPRQRDTDGDRIGNACDPDIAVRNDCRVNFADLNTLKDAFFSTPAAAEWNPDADFNGDNRVNFADLDTMKTAFFGPPGPSAGGCN